MPELIWNRHFVYNGRVNQSGRELIIDRVIIRKQGSSDNAYNRIMQSIGTQTAQKDLDELKNAIEDITSDGVITAYEKQGLQREWASLQSAYTSVSEQFEADDTLSGNAAYSTLKTYYNRLSAIMGKVFADMSSDYIGDDIKEISSDFEKVYEQITICQSLLNGINDFQRNYSIGISGNRDVLSGTTISAGIYRGGIEQENPEFIDGQNYTWRRVDESSGFAERKGKTLTVDSDDLPVSPCRFSATWIDPDDSTKTLAIIFELRYGTIKEYAWSNAITEEELKGLMPSAWSNPAQEQPANAKYLWRRESSDNRKTYQYFRETGEQSEPGYLMSLTVDSVAFSAAPDGTVDTEGFGVVSQVIITHGNDREDLSEWTLTAIPDQPSLIASSVTASGAISVTAFDKSIDRGTIAITAEKGDITLTKAIGIIKAKDGVDGSEGIAPKYYYKYTKTNEPDAWKGGASLFVHGNKLLAVGSTLLSAGMGGWLDHIPEGTQYEDDFLWIKIVHANGTEDIYLATQQGPPAMDIRIIASDMTYQLTTRGVVKADTDFTFTLERNYVNGAASWSHSPLVSDITVLPSDNPDVYKLRIAKGSTIQSFLVSVSCSGFAVTRDLRIMGVDGGEEVPYYFKVYPLSSTDAMPIYNRELGTLSTAGVTFPDYAPDGPLIDGDYILFKTMVIQNTSDTEGHVEPIPFYYDKSSETWKMVDYNSPNYSAIMSGVLADAVRMDDMPASVGALYGFFQNLSAYSAFIDNLFSNKIQILGAIFGGAYNEAGENPTDGKGFWLSKDGTFKAIEAYLRNATVNGYFETSDSEGTILKSSKDVTGSSLASDVNDAYLPYSLSLSSFPNMDNIFRVPGSNTPYKDWDGYAIPLDYDRDISHSGARKPDTEYDYYSSSIGNIIVARSTYTGSGTSLMQSIPIGFNTSGVRILVRYSYSLYSGSALYTVRLYKNGDTANGISFTDSPPATWTNSNFEVLSLDVSQGDTLNLSMSAAPIFNAEMGQLEAEVIIVMASQKVPLYYDEEGDVQRPYGAMSCFIVENKGYSKTELCPVSGFTSAPAIYSQPYSGAGDTGVVAYNGPVLEIYDESGATLIGETDDPAALHAGGITVNSLYTDVLGSLATGEYLTESTSLFEGDTVSRILAEYTSANGMTITFYGTDSEELGSIWSGAPFRPFSITLIAEKRGVKTSSVYPDKASTYDIGSVAEPYKNIYSDTVTVENLNVDAITVPQFDTLPISSIIPLPNGFYLNQFSIQGSDTLKLNGGTYETRSVYLPSGYTPFYNTVFMSSYDETEGSQPARIRSVTTDYISVEIYSHYHYSGLVILRRQ